MTVKELRNALTALPPEHDDAPITFEGDAQWEIVGIEPMGEEENFAVVINGGENLG